MAELIQNINEKPEDFPRYLKEVINFSILTDKYYLTCVKVSFSLMAISIPPCGLDISWDCAITITDTVTSINIVFLATASLEASPPRCKRPVCTGLYKLD